MPIPAVQDRALHRLRQTARAARRGYQGQWKCRAIPGRSLSKRLVGIGIFAERSPSNRHRFGVLGIIGAELDTTLGLLHDIELIAFLKAQTRQQVSWQNHSKRIAY